MYYRIIDEEGMPRATGYNATDLNDVREGLADLIGPQCEEDLDGVDLSTLLCMERCILEESETPFDDDPMDDYDEGEENFFL